MNEPYDILEKTIKKIFSQYTQRNLVVEFVEDVSVRREAILRQYDLNMQATYEAQHYTGCFLPPNEKYSEYIILIQKNRKDSLYVMTAFHELEHAILHYNLYETIFNCDLEKLKNSSVNCTFQIYSEFSACREGTSNYLRIVEKNGLTRQEFGEQLAGIAICNYNSFLNKISELMRVAQLYGTLLGIKDAIDDFDETKYISQTIIDDFKEILDCMRNYSNNNEWYNEFDLLTKIFLI